MNKATVSHSASPSQTAKGTKSPPLPCAFSTTVIKRAAIWLKRNVEFRDLQRCDLQQELWIRLIQQAPLFDDSRAHWHAYVTTVVNRAARNLLRDRRAGKRADGETTRSAGASDERSAERREFHDSDRLRHKGIQQLSSTEQLELRLDIMEVIRRMPQPLRPIARGLQHRKCPELCVRLKLSETTLRRRVLDIRQHFEDHGLQKTSK